MKRKRLLAALIFTVLLIFQSAHAEGCMISFESGGKTYKMVHHPEGTGYFEILGDNPHKWWNPMRHDFTAEELAFDEAYRTVTKEHVASCPYYRSAELGDTRLPLWLLAGFAGVSLAGIGIVLKMRRSLI